MEDKLATFLGGLDDEWLAANGHGVWQGSGEGNGTGIGYGISDSCGGDDGIGYGYRFCYGYDDDVVGGRDIVEEYSEGYGRTNSHCDDNGDGEGGGDCSAPIVAGGKGLYSVDGKRVYVVNGEPVIIGGVYGEYAFGYIVNTITDLEQVFIVKYQGRCGTGKNLIKAYMDAAKVALTFKDNEYNKQSSQSRANNGTGTRGL